METQVSHGFCLNIDEIGNLLISHDGDVVLNAKADLKQSVKIVAPKQVILNGIIAKDIEVESTAAILTGETSANIKPLKFKAIKDSVDLENALVIDKDSSLEIENLTLEEALLLNAGRFVNLGEIKAGVINMISSELFHNKGGISTTAFFNIDSLGKSVNEGKIKGNSGLVNIFGTRFEQRKELSSAKIAFNTKEALLLGETKGQEGFFHENTQNAGNLFFQKGVLDGNFVSSGNYDNLEGDPLLMRPGYMLEKYG